MHKASIGLLNKKRGNFVLQKKYVGQGRVLDTTAAEVEHHRQSLERAGYSVRVLTWGSDIIQQLMDADIDLVFNVSSLVEAAILEELGIPYVGSNPFTISLATDKSLAKRIWEHAGLPTSPFVVAHAPTDCEPFRETPPFPYPLFIKPVAGRGSAGIDEHSVVWDYQQLVDGVSRLLQRVGQPVLIERFLHGREITIGIVGNGQSARTLPMLEIRYGQGSMTLTFDRKERDDNSFFCPAPLVAEQIGQLKSLAMQAYHALGFYDYGRIDTILTEDGPFLLEGNTFAGLTCTPAEKPHSYIGFMARAEGKGGCELLDEIIQVAMARLGVGASAR